MTLRLDVAYTEHSGALHTTGGFSEVHDFFYRYHFTRDWAKTSLMINQTKHGVSFVA